MVHGVLARLSLIAAVLLVSSFVGLPAANSASQATAHDVAVDARNAARTGSVTAYISPRSSATYTMLSGGTSAYPSDNYCQRYVKQTVTWHLRAVSSTRIYVTKVQVRYYSNTAFTLGGGWLSNGTSSVRYRTASGTLAAGSHSFSYPIGRYLYTSGTPKGIYLKQNLQGAMSPEPYFCRAGSYLIHRLVVR